MTSLEIMQAAVHRTTSAVVIAIATIAVTTAAWSQANKGDIWFELPPEGCNAGQPLTVKVYVNVGDQQLNAVEFQIGFDNSLLPVAFSESTGFPPVFTNPDIALGRTLVDADIDDLQAYHQEANPGVIPVTRVGGKGPAWPLTGNIELLRITFHPQSEDVTATIGGAVTVLLDEDLNDIGTPQLIPKTVSIGQRLPGLGTIGLGLSAGTCLLYGLLALRRQELIPATTPNRNGQ